jgi:hypothetical protein
MFLLSVAMILDQLVFTSDFAQHFKLARLMDNRTEQCLTLLRPLTSNGECEAVMNTPTT